jgi:hypothetical protein
MNLPDPERHPLARAVCDFCICGIALVVALFFLGWIVMWIADRR